MLRLSKAILTAACTLWVLTLHAAVPHNDCTILESIYKGDKTIGALSMDEFNALSACVNQPLDFIDLSMLVSRCSDYHLAVEMNLFEQKVNLKVLKDLNTGDTKYKLSLNTQLIGLNEGNFFFGPDRHYLEPGMSDLLKFVGDNGYYRDLADVVTALQAATADTSADPSEDPCAPASTAAPTQEEQEEAFDNPTGAFGVYAWDVDALKILFEGLYQDFKNSDVVSYVYQSATYSTRNGLSMGAVSLVQELVSSLVPSCAADGAWQDCAPFATLTDTLRALLGIADDGYLETSYGDSGETYASVLSAAGSAGVTLWDTYQAALAGYGLDTTVSTDSTESVVCGVDDENPNGTFTIPASQVDLSNALTNLASDSSTGNQDVIEQWVRGLLCTQDDSGLYCDADHAKSAYFEQLRNLFDTVLLNQTSYPTFDLSTALAYGMGGVTGQTADGITVDSDFLAADPDPAADPDNTKDNLRTALNVVNAHVWTVIDAFKAAYADGADLVALNQSYCPVDATVASTTTAQKTAATASTAENDLDAFYKAQWPLTVEGTYTDDDGDGYPEVFDGLQDEFSAQHFDEYYNTPAYDTMAEYWALKEGYLLNCGDGSGAPVSMQEICAIIWCKNKAAIDQYHVGNFSDFYTDDVRGMILEEHVAKMYQLYLHLGYTLFWGLPESQHVNAYEIAIDEWPIASSSSTSSSGDSSSGQETIAELTDPSNPTLDKLWVVLTTVYTASESTQSKWTTVPEFSQVTDGLRALIKGDISPIPIETFFAPLYRVADTQNATTNLDHSLSSWGDTLVDCASDVARGMVELGKASTFVSCFPEIIGKSSDTMCGASSGTASTLSTTLNDTVKPYLQDPSAFYKALAVFQDPGWFHYLFRDKDGSGAQLYTAIDWLHDNLMQSHLVDYVSRAMKIAFDAAAYPLRYLVPYTMDEISQRNAALAAALADESDTSGSQTEKIDDPKKKSRSFQDLLNQSRAHDRRETRRDNRQDNRDDYRGDHQNGGQSGSSSGSGDGGQRGDGPGPGTASGNDRGPDGRSPDGRRPDGRSPDGRSPGGRHAQ